MFIVVVLYNSNSHWFSRIKTWPVTVFWFLQSDPFGSLLKFLHAKNLNLVFSYWQAAISSLEGMSILTSNFIPVQHYQNLQFPAMKTQTLPPLDRLGFKKPLFKSL